MAKEPGHKIWCGRRSQIDGDSAAAEEDFDSECQMEINGENKALEVPADHCGAKAVKAKPALEEDA